MIDHEATWRMEVPRLDPKPSPPDPDSWRIALGGIATGMAVPGLLWWLLTFLIDSVDAMSARPWTLPPRPPPITAPIVIVPRTIVEMPCVIANTTTVAAAPRKRISPRGRNKGAQDVYNNLH